MENRYNLLVTPFREEATTLYNKLHEVAVTSPEMLLAEIACMLAAIEDRAVMSAVQVMHPTPEQLDRMQSYLHLRHKKYGS